MSSRRVSSIWRRLAGGLAVSVVIGAATWLAVTGAKVIAFDRQAAAARDLTGAHALGTPVSHDDVAHAAAIADRLGAWRQEPGFRHRARRAARELERHLRPFAMEALQSAAAVVDVSPADGWGWIDVAATAQLVQGGAALSARALEMAYLVAPFEELQAEHRIRFVLANWPRASEAQKARTSRAIASLLHAPSHFRTGAWQEMRARLTPAVRAELDSRLSGQDPGGASR